MKFRYGNMIMIDISPHTVADGISRKPRVTSLLDAPSYYHSGSTMNHRKSTYILLLEVSMIKYQILMIGRS